MLKKQPNQPVTCSSSVTRHPRPWRCEHLADTAEPPGSREKATLPKCSCLWGVAKLLQHRMSEFYPYRFGLAGDQASSAQHPCHRTATERRRCPLPDTARPPQAGVHRELQLFSCKVSLIALIPPHPAVITTPSCCSDSGWGLHGDGKPASLCNVCSGASSEKQQSSLHPFPFT